MATESMEQGQTITVTYSISQENLSENEAKELIRSNAPSGFDVQNVELGERKET